MGDARILWALLAPLIAGAPAVLLLRGLSAESRSERARWWLGAAALVAACGGLLAETALLLPAEGAFNGLQGLGITLTMTPFAGLGVVAANMALLCVLFASRQHRLWAEEGAAAEALTVTVGVMLAASLIGGALLLGDRRAQAFCLLGVAMCVAAVAALPPPSGKEGKGELEAMSKRLAGALKHVSMATIATGLLVAGLLILARYPFNLQDTGPLQVGLGLLSVGLAVRAGVMPFANGAGDLTEAAPKAAIMMLGAATPAVLVAGLLMLAPLEPALPDVSQTGRQVALGLGAVGALLAGVRALAVRSEAFRGDDSADRAYALLVSSGAALQTSWALFGVLSGSSLGATGAAMLALNMALAVPLLVLSKRGVGLAIGAGSLLGLPPLGGFAGTLLVAQAATGIGGVWTALLLLGSILTAAAWLGNAECGMFRMRNAECGMRNVPNAEYELVGSEKAGKAEAPIWLLWALMAAQVGLFALSGIIIELL